MEEDCDFEHSHLSGQFAHDGMTVDVEIYRISGTEDPWCLEVVNESGGCTRWYGRFATEVAAYQAFIAVLETGGLSFFDTVRHQAWH